MALAEFILYQWRWGLRPHIFGEAFPFSLWEYFLWGLLLAGCSIGAYLVFKREQLLLMDFPILFVCRFCRGVLVAVCCLSQKRRR